MCVWNSESFVIKWCKKCYKRIKKTFEALKFILGVKTSVSDKLISTQGLLTCYSGAFNLLCAAIELLKKLAGRPWVESGAHLNRKAQISRQMKAHYPIWICANITGALRGCLLGSTVLDASQVLQLLCRITVSFCLICAGLEAAEALKSESEYEVMRSL